MKTLFCPCHDSVNESVNKNIEFLNSMGVETYDFADFKNKPFKLFSLETVNLNWYEDINEENQLKAYLILIKKIIVISVLKIANIRIIYTLHNKIAHDGKSQKANLVLKKFLIKQADVISLLSHRSKDYIKKIAGNDIDDRKFFYVGHPVYDCILDDRLVLPNNNKMIFLYFGMIRPYKNIELLIKVWKELGLKNARLLIVGKPINEEYRKTIINVAENNNNIILKLNFIPNEELDRLILQSHVIISPLDITSSMNSGTLIKAMSMGRTVIMPDIEMTYDYDASNMFLYHYNSEQSHDQALRERLKDAYDIFVNNPDRLLSMGIALKKNVYEINKDEVYKERYRELYFGERFK